MKKIEGYKPIETMDAIKLNGNECFYDIAKDNIEDLVKILREVEFNRYPQNSGDILRKKYSEYSGVGVKNLIVGNGSDEMIALVIGAYIKNGKKLLTLNPDFSMYDFYASSHEGELIKLNCNEDGSYRVEDFIELGKKEKVDLVVFSNPNNPTGYGRTRGEIEKILREFKDTIVLVDEAYIEFYPEETVINLIDKYPNLLVTRTLSKAFGGAAFRVGFIAGNSSLIEDLREFKVPYNVNSLSQVMGSRLLENVKIMEKYRDIVLEERNRVFKELESLREKFKVYPSKTNFIYGRGDKGFLKVLEKEKIIIRNFNDDTFRITIGSKRENDKLIALIREWSRDE